MEFVKMPEEVCVVKERLAIDFSERFIKQDGPVREQVKKSFKAGFETGFNAAYILKK